MVKDLLHVKGKRIIALVKVTREESALAAFAAGMGMIGAAFGSHRVQSVYRGWSPRMVEALVRKGASVI